VNAPTWGTPVAGIAAPTLLDRVRARWAAWCEARMTRTGVVSSDGRTQVVGTLRGDATRPPPPLQVAPMHQAARLARFREEMATFEASRRTAVPRPLPTPRPSDGQRCSR
jgi:hypothetical protein